jgi:hypothetical protein
MLRSKLGLTTVTANGSSRRNLAVAGRCGEGPFTIRFADLHHLCGANRWVDDLRPGNPPESKLDGGEG